MLKYIVKNSGYTAICFTRKAAEESYNREKKKGNNPTLTIVSTSATNEQEREALKKLKEIIQSLGPESYLAEAVKMLFIYTEEHLNRDDDFLENLFGDEEKHYEVKL